MLLLLLIIIIIIIIIILGMVHILRRFLSINKKLPWYLRIKDWPRFQESVGGNINSTEKVYNNNFVGLTQITDKASISRQSNVDHSLRQSVKPQIISFIYMNMLQVKIKFRLTTLILNFLYLLALIIHELGLGGKGNCKKIINIINYKILT